MHGLGARSLPVVSRGDTFVFAQVIKDVVAFLGLPQDAEPNLSPDELKARDDTILAAAVRLIGQMPDERLEKQLPDRPGSWRVLLHHVFQIATAYPDMEETGESLSYDNMVAEPPAGMTTSAAIAGFGSRVRARFAVWAAKTAGEDFSGQVPTDFGGTTRYEILERTVWPSTRHVRQVAALLEEIGVAPDRPLTAIETDGLPLPNGTWG